MSGEKEVPKCFPFPNPKAQGRGLLTPRSTATSHSGTGASLCDGWKEAHTFFLPLSIFKSYLLQEPLYSYEASTRLSPFSGFLNLYLSFMVYGPSANPVAPWTYSPPTDCSIRLKEIEHSEVGLLNSSPGNPSELLEIMSKPRPCKAKLNQQRKADQAVSLALEQMTFKCALLIHPESFQAGKKRHMPLPWDSSYWSPLCRNTFSKSPCP